ncbi:MAG: DNA polymerase III subunit beta, partial [Thermodesulfobacteriota bacterium]
MEFNIERDEFIKVLQRIQGIVEKRNTMPILANVFIEAGPGNVTIMASDLEIFIKDICPAIVKKKGSVTVNARKLFEIIKQLSVNSVDITVGENEKVTIKSGKSRFNIMGLPSKEFPAFPQVEENKLFKIDPEILKDMIDKTSFAVSTDETRYNINGFYMEKKDSKVKIITTDGHRLSIVEKEAEGINAEKEGVILPKKGVFELRKLLDEEGAFFFGIMKKSATIKKDSTIMNIRLI